MSSSPRLVLLTLWLAGFCAHNAVAADTPASPIVRAELSSDSIRVGESARLRITVLGPTWFPKAPVFPSLEIANAVVRLPSNSSRSTSETIGRERWNGVTRNYEIFPLMGATYVLGGQTLQVTVANPGADSIISSLRIPEVRLRAQVPAGAETLDPYLAGTELRLRREIDGETSELAVGDALVVRYIAELDGAPALFLPPLTPTVETRTAVVYTEEPVFTDETGSNSTTSRRVEQSTLVFNYGGDVVLPALTQHWWNHDSQRIETATVAALTIPVSGPSPATNAPPDATSRNWRSAAVLLIGLVGIWAFARFALIPAWQRYQTAQIEYRASEAYAFAQLTKMLGRQDPHTSYHAIVRWQQKLCAQLELRAFVRQFGPPALETAIEQLSRHLYADADPASAAVAAGRKLAAALTVARTAYLDSRGQHAPLIPRLNP